MTGEKSRMESEKISVLLSLSTPQSGHVVRAEKGLFQGHVLCLDLPLRPV